MPKTVPDQAPEPPRLSWGKVSLPDNEPGLFSLGHLRLWLKFFDGDLWLCPVQAAETEAEIALPAAPNWQRWTLGKRHGQLEIVPALPDLPLVINPEDPLHLPPGIECQIYVSIPLWVELQIGKNSLLRVPTLQLSKTWFGNFVAGELCYALTTRARRVAGRGAPDPWIVHCPITIHNGDDENLDVEKVRLEVSRLSIYEYEQARWANQVRVHYRGQRHFSEIDIVNGPPSEVSRAKRIRKSRVAPHRSFTAKTFSSLADLAGLDFFNR